MMNFAPTIFSRSKLIKIIYAHRKNAFDHYHSWRIGSVLFQCIRAFQNYRSTIMEYGIVNVFN